MKPISFTPEEVREANGRFGIFRYRLTDSDGVVRVINCRIPYSASAYASLAGRLDVIGEIRRQSLIPSIETFGDDEGCGAENNPCILPPIIVEWS